MWYSLLCSRAKVLHSFANWVSPEPPPVPSPLEPTLEVRPGGAGLGGLSAGSPLQGQQRSLTVVGAPGRLSQADLL